MAEQSGQMGSQAIEVLILSDNAAPVGLTCEWGFAALVRLPSGRSWLWDTGAGPAFLSNAATLGADVSSPVGLALSHGHWDHTRGLPHLFDAGYAGPIFAHPSCLQERYAIEKRLPKAAGIPKEVAERVRERLRAVSGTQRLDDGLTMVTDIPRRPGNSEHVQDLYLDADGRVADHMPDDAFLLLDTPAGPVALFGCCHAGLANSLSHLRDSLGITRLHAVIGGLHLYAADKPDIEEAARLMEEFGVERIHTGHCTGPKATRLFESRLGAGVRPLAAGVRLAFPPAP